MICYAIYSVAFRSRFPFLDPIDTMLYHGAVFPSIVDTTLPENRSLPMSMYISCANEIHIMMHRRLIASSPVATLISNQRPIELRPVSVLGWFNFSIPLSGRDSDNGFDFYRNYEVEYDLDATALNVAQRHLCHNNNPLQYYELVTPKPASSSEYIEIEKARCNGGSIGAPNIRIHPNELEHYGMFHSRGFSCMPDIYDLLAAYVEDNIYFHVQKIEV